MDVRIMWLTKHESCTNSAGRAIALDIFSYPKRFLAGGVSHFEYSVSILMAGEQELNLC